MYIKPICINCIHWLYYLTYGYVIKVLIILNTTSTDQLATIMVSVPKPLPP